MTVIRSTRRALAALAVTLGAAAVAVAPTAGAAPAVAHPTVATRATTLGTFLVDAKGRTLYLFLKDRKDVDSCHGTCAEVWPPDLVTGTPVGGGKAIAKLLGSIRLADGKHQVTYNGHPLYTYVADAKPGQVTGQGVNQFGANWYVVNPRGSKIDND